MALPAQMGVNFVHTTHNDIYPAIDPTKSSLSQPSKCVLITGAGRGIGRSIALRYAECDVACLILCARTTSQLDEVEAAIHVINPEVRVRKLPLDVSTESQVSSVAETVESEEGRLDVLVNNAGHGEPWLPIADGNASEWWRVWEVNLHGPYLMLKSFLPLMVATAKEYGTTVHDVNVASIGAHVVFPGASGYQTSKLALLRLTEFVDTEYGHKGVNAIAVHPGGVLTDLASKMPKELVPMLKDTPDLCGGFVTWITYEKRTWLGGRYLSAAWDVDELEAKKQEIVEGDKLKVRMVV